MAREQRSLLCYSSAVSFLFYSSAVRTQDATAISSSPGLNLGDNRCSTLWMLAHPQTESFAIYAAEGDVEHVSFKLALIFGQCIGVSGRLGSLCPNSAR